MSFYEKVEINEDKLLRIPIKRENYPKLESTSNLAASLVYLDKLYSQKLLKSNENNDNEYIISNHKNTLKALIDTLYDLSSFSTTQSNLTALDKTTKQTQNELKTHLLQLSNYNYTDREFSFEYKLTNQQQNASSSSNTTSATSTNNDSIVSTSIFNLYDILLYSPCSIIDLSYEKILFIFYQLLKILQLLHNLNINCGNLKLNNLYINQNYWLRIRLPFKDILLLYEHNEPVIDASSKNESYLLVKSNMLLKQDLIALYDCYKHLKYDELIQITSDWCKCKLDNFNYLLILNTLVGRKLNCPYNHPIFPWIIDFKENKRQNLRDLSKTKYRLNKTDTHLDFTYQESSSTSAGGYHLVEFLSEITYFVYKSRITDAHTLCTHVRSVWVPNEYPSSMPRLYAWTPEECIPEFFCDTSIFTSIHDDMPDLAVPEWCNGSKEEFIKAHRALLESDIISQSIHQWIDLVFGYKLGGDAAIQAKNVCLPLIDNHETMRPYGVVQLFTVPHPIKIAKDVDKAALDIRRNVRSRTDFIQEDARPKSATTLLTLESDRKKTIKIDPIDVRNVTAVYPNPLAPLEQIESLLKFTQKSYHSLPASASKKINSNSATFEDLKAYDLKCITCILAEILLIQKLKSLPTESSLEERMKIICSIIKKEPHLIPSTFRSLIFNILIDIDEITTTTAARKSKNALFKANKSQLTVDLLLNQQIAIIPFKYYFNNLYNLSELLNRIDFIIENYNEIKSVNIAELSLLSNSSSNSVENSELVLSNDMGLKQLIIETLYEQKFFIALNTIPLILNDMNNIKLNNFQQLNKILNTNSTSSSFELILTYVQNLLENPYTCINSIVYLFNKVAGFLSQNDLEKKFLSIILHLLNVIDLEKTVGLNLNNSKMNKIELKLNLCKLFEFKFINNLRILFGLNKFLNQIVPLIVEAISGLKDIHVTNEDRKIRSSRQGKLQQQQQLAPQQIIKQQQQQQSDIFQMDAALASTSVSSARSDDFNEASVSDNIEYNSPTASANEIMFNLDSGGAAAGVTSSVSNNDDSVTDEFLSEINEDNYNIDDLNTNISIVARITFNRIIIQLGPVLTCKYFCTNLLKMLAICYMNEKCLANIEDLENPLNSLKSIEGDKFAYHILESLKEVSSLYGEHLIVIQYFAHVSNTVGACSHRLTYRLEASLLAGIVLVHYFVAYLDLKLLMDYLQYIFNQILLPAIKINSNLEIKFPNGYVIRNILCYKLLDILLLISLRLGRENTRVEMELIFRTFFDSFSIHSSLNSSQSTNTSSSNVQVTETQPLAIEQKINRTSNNITMATSFKSLLAPAKDLSSDSTDGYYKLSYNRSTNEILGSSFKPDKHISSIAVNETSSKFRSQSFTLLSLNNDDQEAPASQLLSELSPSIPNKEPLNEELLNTFTPELAYIAYFSVSRHISNNYVDSILSNGDLIHQLCLEYEKTKSKDPSKAKNIQRANKKRGTKIQPIKKPQSNQLIHSSSYGSSFNENISVVGSQIQINSFSIEEDIFSGGDSLFVNNTLSVKFNEQELKEAKTTTVDTSRHLSDNWFAYWEHEIQNNQKTNNFDFKHISLMNFMGHTSTIRCISALDNESSIITASKDKTVKLWTLRNQGGGRKSQQNCQWTYTQHKKPVFNVFFMDSLRLCVSCDGIIHTWDPFVGKKLCQYDSQPVQCIGNLPAPSQYIMAATADNFIKFIDLRSKGFAYEFRTINTSAGSIKCITANDNTLLAAYSNGLMCLLDIRTGWLQDSFRPHENEILQLKFYSCERFASSYTDGSIALSSNKDAFNSKVQLKSFLKVYNDPVSCLVVNENQVISGTTSNKIGIHSNIDKQNQTTFSLNKLQPDFFKGALTSMAYLPMNRLLLLGSDNGEMKLFC